MLWIRPEQKVQIVYLDREAAVPAPTVASAHVPQDPEEPTHRAIVSDEPLRIAIDPSVARAAETRRPIPPAHNYLQTREVALRMGLDAIGSPRRVGDGAVSPTYFDWLSSLAEAPAEAQQSAAGLPSKM
jgi:hypothetical protein